MSTPTPAASAALPERHPTDGPYTHSPQRGLPRDCYVAQVFDCSGNPFAEIVPTDDPAVASQRAALIARLLNAQAAPQGAQAEPRQGALISRVANLEQDNEHPRLEVERLQRAAPAAPAQEPAPLTAEKVRASIESAISVARKFEAPAQEPQQPARGDAPLEDWPEAVRADLCRFLYAAAGAGQMFAGVDALDLYARLFRPPPAQGAAPSSTAPSPAPAVQPTVRGRLYKHVKSGGLYELVCEAKTEADGAEVVVYRDIETLQTWVRPRRELFDGRFRLVQGGSNG